MARALRGLICLIAALTALATPAQDPPGGPAPDPAASEYFAAGTAAFERGDYAAAREAFRSAIARGSAGPSAWYNAAVAEYRLGDYPAAVASFRSLGRQFPEFAALAEYNLGLALLQQDETDPARAAFERAAGSGDPQIETLALTMLGRLPPAPVEPARRWLRWIELGLGHDDNVVLADPLGLPAGQSAESPFAELAFYAGGPVTPNEQWTLAANAYLLDYPDAADYDQGAFQLGAARESRAGNWRLIAGPRIGRSTIGGDGFEEYLGAAFESRRPLAAMGANLSIVLSYDSAEAIEERFAYVEGDRRALALRFDKSLARATLTFDVRRGVDDRVGAGVSAEHDRYRLSWRRPWGALWTSDLVFELRDTVYAELEPAREEQRLQSGLRAERRLGADWLLHLRYGYADNDSSDPRFSYQRHLIGAGASRTF